MRKLLSPLNLLVALFIASFSSAMAIETNGDKEALIASFERAKAYTAEYMDAMPADGYSFKATDDVRTFAQQFLHIASANYFFTATLLGIDNPKDGVDFEKTESFQGKEAAMKEVAASYDYIISTINGMTKEQLGETIKVFGQFEMTKGVGFGKAFEHGTHHRGQTTIYLRMKGVTPPQEKLF